jgi:hypothetical protein
MSTAHLSIQDDYVLCDSDSPYSAVDSILTSPQTAMDKTLSLYNVSDKSVPIQLYRERITASQDSLKEIEKLVKSLRTSQKVLLYDSTRWANNKHATILGLNNQLKELHSRMRWEFPMVLGSLENKVSV